MTKHFIERNCYSCDIDLMVVSHDVSERYYCNSCAWAKFSGTYDNRTSQGATHE